MDNAKHCANPACNLLFQGRANKIYCSKECGQHVINRRHAKYEPTVAAALRKCHDCGRPTADYRCQNCLRKWRMEHGVSLGDYGVTALDIGF